MPVEDTHAAEEDANPYTVGPGAHVQFGEEPRSVFSALCIPTSAQCGQTDWS